ncbi:MAG: peptidylprolyl isomerase [Cypionkella sp.]|nr:peptidylprolyl isomerase [Cypionkella sp.]
MPYTILSRSNLVIDITGAANGQVVIDLAADTAPQHVSQVTALAKSGVYDGVVFHRVIDGFMAQTGDVQYGKAGSETAMAGMGGSEMPNIPAEFTQETFARGVVGMARAQDPNSANSQFFIMQFNDRAEFLDGQYTMIGQGCVGDGGWWTCIKLGEGQNAASDRRPM